MHGNNRFRAFFALKLRLDNNSREKHSDAL